MLRSHLEAAWPTPRRTAILVFALGLSGTALAQSPAPSGLFRPYVAFPTPGLTAEAVAVGDLNGDGRKDVALVAGPAGANSTLLVYLQGPGGALASPARYAVGYSQSVATGDVNGDGRLDAVVGNASSIGVLAQDASGALLPMVEYPTGYLSANPHIVMTGDFDGDGRTDVVAIGWGNSNVFVYLQNASGTLDAPVLYPVDHGGYDEVDVGDVNGDGRDDIVVMSGQLFAFDNLGILLQKAGGGFAAPVYYDLGGQEITRGVAVGDVDGDGREDAVVTYDAWEGGTGFAVFAQNREGTLNAPSLVPCTAASPCSGGLQAVEVADVDGDGRREVIILQGSGGGLRTERPGTGGGFVTVGVDALPYVTWYNPQALAVGDINGDWLPDVAVADDYNGLVVLYGRGSCSECVRDGGFEGGIPNPSWAEFSSTFGTPLCTVAICGSGSATAGPRSGSVWAWFGGVARAEEVGYVAQDAVLPQGTATLRFYLWNGAWSGNGADSFAAFVDGNEVFSTLEGNPAYTPGYRPVTVGLNAFADGGPHQLVLGAHTIGPRVTNFSLDDVSLESCVLPSTSVSISDASVTEAGPGSTTATFAVSLAEPSTGTVKVSWATADDTARAGSDYLAASGTLVFPPGTTSATVSVDVLGDRIFEPQERFFVNLLDPVRAVVERGQGIGVVTDDDDAGLSIDDATVTAPGTVATSAVFTVTLAPPGAGSASVDYATRDGTALAGVDYEATSGTLTFPPGTPSHTVPVVVLPNALAAGARTFEVELSGASGASIAYGVGTGTILAPGFHTVTPCRLFDTRNPLDGPALPAHATRTVPIFGRCGIPPTARSVLFNVAVTQPTAAGYVTLYPGGASVPKVSAVNYAAGQTRSNNAIIHLNAEGQVSMYSGQGAGTVHVILDVSGYFTSE